MKQILTYMLYTLLLSTPLLAQDTTNNWQQSLAAELKTLDNSASVSVWKQSADKISGLANEHPKEWLLQYYAGWANTQASFKSDSPEALCDKAEAHVKKALDMQPSHSETLTLMAYWMSAKINAQHSRGVTLGSQSKKYAERAIEANPANPRAYLVKALVIYHTPAMFGGGKKKAKPVVEQAAQKYASFKPKSQLDPDWGENIYEELAKKYQ
ncbi:hypothetical protein MKQ68_08085 [Chitinophaga horti]|uniref:Uncharacterized protein n=1 Tax=Chitinophaga horti TaxID=2920382 RepID=A0ABY6J612_9BACT|nr:hypothetical protein [Chitinophaga horti]UYQ95052.1 hypothetical protein MKQ68_08085 [Chitinophaga horti]